MTDTATELLTFELGAQEYALDIMCVREIRGWTTATPLPHAPAHMKGVINLRGVVLPVVDLAVRLDLPPGAQSTRNVIVVVKFEDAMTGLLVDSVSDIITVAPDDIQTPPDGSDGSAPRIVSALTLVDERMIRILNLDAVLSAAQSDAA